MSTPKPATPVAEGERAPRKRRRRRGGRRIEGGEAASATAAPVATREIKPTSKGNRGLVRTFNKVVNQRGETVLTYNPLRLMAGKE